MSRRPSGLLLLLLLLLLPAAAVSALRSEQLNGPLRNLQQANAPAIAPQATRSTAPLLAPVPPTNFGALARSSPAVNTANGAFVGCFDITKLTGMDWSSQVKLSPITSCRAHCENRWFAFSIIKSWGGCICTMELPGEGARLPNSVCDANTNGNAVAVFYLHQYASSRACRLLNVPMQPASFRWAYNQDKTSFDGSTMTIRQDGSSGARLYYPLALEFGLVEVTAKVSGASGVVSAFYLRSDTQQETSDFSEIDFEFVNGNPGVPGALWTNSFKGGSTFGEKMIPPTTYKPQIKSNCGAHECFLNFKIHWQPNQVSWIVNNRVVRRNYYDQPMRWADMNGVVTEKAYRPPTKPSFPTFSMWHDHDHGGAFGGALASSGPFYSNFKNLRLVACDQPLSAYNGPSWTYGGAAAASCRACD